MSFTNLQNHFLIAMPHLKEIHFHRAVIYLCAHNEEGAMGMIVNHPLIDIHLDEVMRQMDINIGTQKLDHIPVLLGGPVQPERGFILHHKQGKWESSLKVSDEIIMTSSQDILQSLAKNQGPNKYLTLLGYAGLSNEQLEK